MIGTTTIENVLQGFASATSSPDGGQSTMRHIAYLWGVVLCLGIALIVVKKTAFPDIPESILYLTGIILLGKVGEKHLETRAVKDSQPTQQ